MILYIILYYIISYYMCIYIFREYSTSSDPHRGISRHIFWHRRWGPAMPTDHTWQVVEKKPSTEAPRDSKPASGSLQVDPGKSRFSVNSWLIFACFFQLSINENIVGTLK